MPRTKKIADVKANETKTPEVKEVVKAAPVEAVKEPVKAETKKAGRKPAAKKAASSVKEEKHDIVRLPDAITEGTKIVFDENGKTKIVNVSDKDTDKKAVKKAGRKPAAKKAAPSVKEEKHDIVRLPDAITEGTKIVFDENGKTKIVNVSNKDTDKKTVKKAGRKPATKKAASVKKETAKSEVKAEPKKAGRKPAAKAEKKAPTKATKPVITSVLQVAGNEFDFDKVVKAVEGLKKKNEGKSLEIYIKPEDNAIYYVVNGKGGKKIDI